MVWHSPIRCRELSSLAAIDEAKPTIPNKNPLAVIEDETLRHKLKVRAMIRGRCHQIILIVCQGGEDGRGDGGGVSQES